MGEMEKSM